MKIRFVTSLLLLLTILFSSSFAMAEDAFTPAQEKQLQTIIHDYILKNPQVLLEAVQNLQKKANQEMMAHAQEIISAKANSLFNAPTSPVVGNPKGSITLVEFFDYQCPYCKRLSPAINQAMKDNNNLRVVYKELPIFGASSNFAAQAAIAAQKQNKYLAFHNALMAAKPPFSEQQILDAAKSVGLDVKKLQADMNDKDVIAEIKNNIALANDLQLVGTPAFIVAKVTFENNTTKTGKIVFIPGAIDENKLRAVISQVQ